MSQSTVSTPPVYTISEQHLEDRVRLATVRREWRRARQLLRQAMAQSLAYDGSPLGGRFGQPTWFARSRSARAGAFTIRNDWSSIA